MGADGMRAEEDEARMPPAMGASQARPGPAPLTGVQHSATPKSRVESAATGSRTLISEPMNAAAGGDDVAGQRAAAGTHPPHGDGQRHNAANTPVATSHARDNDEVGLGVSAGDKALEVAKEDDENSQAAPAAGKALRHEVKDVGIWLLRQVVRAVLVLGPVAAIILLDIFKERD